MKRNLRNKTAAGLLLFTSGFALPVIAQPSAPPPTDGSDEMADEVVVLSPFEVTAEDSTGYVATSTLAGTRINTQLKDVGSAISVVTSEFLRDTGATDNKTLLQYTTNTEVGGIYGNFMNARSGVQDESANFRSPNTNTRVRGLTSADNTRDFFITNVPWDVYNVDRVDMQRGPNSILFGLGSPAGIINTTAKTAQFRDFGELQFRFGSFGSNRTMLDVNRELIDDELSARVVVLKNDEHYKQDPAYSLDERFYGTTRWEPRFLNRGEIKTTLKVNYESGHVKSNNPRQVSPIDYISPWYTDMNKALYDPRTVQDNNPHYQYDANDVESTYYPANHGEFKATRFNGSVNPDFEPWLGNFGSSFGGIFMDFAPGTTTNPVVSLSEFANIRAINSSGGVDGGIDYFTFSRRSSVDTFVQYATDARLPYYQFGLYKNPTMTDSSIFDFYNNLLDGENKQEWQNFNSFSASLSQTYFNQKLGFEAAYYSENYDNGQLSLLSDQRAGIYIDLNSFNLDGTPNANVGRPFLTDAGIYGNNSQDVNREASRITAYFDHNFNEHGESTWFKKLLGRHLISGLLSQESYATDTRNFMRWGTDTEYARLVTNNYRSQKITDNQRVISPVIYLSDSLASRSTASGAYISRPGEEVQIPRIAQMYYFESTWNPPGGVNASAPWTNPVSGRRQTQSENPANYVGWRTTPVNILNYQNGDADALTRSASLSKRDVESKAAVWQAYLWDGAVVGTYGIRQDEVKSWARNASTNWVVNTGTSNQTYDLGRVNFASGYTLPDTATVTPKQNSPSWSVVVKVNDLIGDRLPLDVSLYYNKSENFQVTGTRVDIYNHALPLPSGTTEDKGILLSTKDNRYSLKINKYVSNVKDASGTSGLNTWFLGGFMGWGSNYADVFQNHLGYVGDATSVETPASRSWHWNYSPTSGQTQDQANALRDQHVAAWRALQAAVPAEFYTAWNFGDIHAIRDHGQGTAPAGFTLTEDQISEGYEFEATANPTPNWRVTLNASKVEAIRNNVGGSALAGFVDIVNTAMVGTAGDLRIWGGDPSNTIRNSWNGNFYSDYSRMRLSEGNVSPELRKWRFNLVTSYDFRSGFLKGVNAGVGYRWQDKIAIGYRPVDTTNPNIITFDIDNPYMGPSEDAIDLWVGYRRRIADKYEWQIQLNVRDAFESNHLIPLTTQPDGTVAAWRIAPSQSWTITNTLKF